MYAKTDWGPSEAGHRPTNASDGIAETRPDGCAASVLYRRATRRADDDVSERCDESAVRCSSHGMSLCFGFGRFTDKLTRDTRWGGCENNEQGLIIWVAAAAPHSFPKNACVIARAYTTGPD
jgi:hypothetical protein